MKKQFITLLLTILFLHVSAQVADSTQNVQDLIKKGVELYDAKEYRQAIETYKEALEIDPNSMIATYELALSYLAIKDYDNASKFSTEVINSKEEKLLTRAYGVKGEALAETGKVDEAIVLLESALREIGSDYYLHFNLALNYFNKSDWDKTLLHAENALNLDKFQSGPYLLSAYALSNKKIWVQSILAFQFFLLNEPGTYRSKIAFEEMLQVMHIKQTTEEPAERSFIQKQLERHANNKEVTENTKTPPPLDTFQGINRKLVYTAIENTLDSLKVSTEIDSIAGDSTKNVDYKSFKEVTRTIFSVLSEENDGTNNGLIWNYQIPVISMILESPYFETYCRYISAAYFPESLKWWEENQELAEKFARWLEKGDEDE
jgi:tetratricopeptide (TPR) repeat protein